MEEAALKEAMSMIPMKRMGQAEEVAGLASYLMSDVAGYVTRQVISINGRDVIDNAVWSLAGMGGVTAIWRKMAGCLGGA